MKNVLLLKGKTEGYFTPLLLGISSIVLYYRSLRWFADTIFLNYSVINLIVLVAIAVALFVRVRKGMQSLEFHFSPVPFAVIIICAIFYWISESFLHMNIISCTICFISFYALTGFFMSFREWLKAIIPVILIIQTLPFGPQLDIYFGFPLRLSAAESVRNILSQFNLNGIAKETIITIENRSADVSEACSGLNGIWTSWLFYFALSWIENKKITVYWILNFVFLNLLIYSCNLFRIFILVLLETVFNLHDIAEIVHVPMGIAGFVFSCFICWYLFSYFPENKKETHEKVRMNELTGVKPEMHKYYLASFTLLSVLIPLTILPASARQQIHNFDFRWSLALPAIEIGLSEGEKSAFLKDGSAGRKYRFSKGEIYGTILLVSSRGWRGHHPPQLCTQANGFVIESSETRLIDSEFPVQFLSLKNTKTRSCFWFQSAELITQDHSSRVWAGLRNNTSEWIMVSVLFDNYQGGNDAPVTDFLKEVKSVISVYLQH